MRRLAFTISLLYLFRPKDTTTVKQFIDNNTKQTAMWKIFKPFFGYEPEADQAPDKRKEMLRMFSLIVTMIPTSTTKRQIDGMENMIAGFEATYYDMENFRDYQQALNNLLNDKRTQVRLKELTKDIEDFS